MPLFIVDETSFGEELQYSEPMRSLEDEPMIEGSSLEEPIPEPVVVVEPSIEDVEPLFCPPVASSEALTFNLVEEGTKKRKTKLIDSMGFAYNVKSKRSYATYWQCTVRPKGAACKASVTERDGQFTPGVSAHNHTAQAGTLTAVKILKAVKAKAMEQKFTPAPAIVNEVRKNVCCRVKCLLNRGWISLGIILWVLSHHVHA